MSVPPSTKPDNGPSVNPQVRHIPIFVEGRDEPLLNKLETNSEIPTNSNSSNHPSTTARGPATSHPLSAQPPQRSPSNGQQQTASPGKNSIFNRVKNFPVRGAFDNEFFQGHQAPSYSGFGQRGGSPARTVPVTTPQPPPPQPKQDTSISKIQNIQRDVLALMDSVDQFKGTSKRDKQYIYLDEMLTQNLLKLDQIDTEGQENIKQARREAIKCINICIAALEQKAEANAGQQQQ